ncbi:MAG: hypothetical protein KGL02_05545 [Acidobacteriota bacterium]|nr:hypothetical protein [Acidobacteriota bacterium]MDE3168613.1 hypothetical protein [Acidobacteriota bacterium]
MGQNADGAVGQLRGREAVTLRSRERAWKFGRLRRRERSVAIIQENRHGLPEQCRGDHQIDCVVSIDIASLKEKAA